MNRPLLPRRALAKTAGLAAAALLPVPLRAQQEDMASRVEALIPELEAYTRNGMKQFDVPGAALAILVGDHVAYTKCFGLRRKQGGEAVTPETVFQIGSTTKAFMATVLAIGVDRGKLKWDDRVVDLDPSFSLKDPYVTREFRVFDLLAQRSGLHPYANDLLFSLGFTPDWIMHSLRYAEPVSSFRSTFAYTNLTHMVAGHIAASALDAPDWPALAKREILDPLGMTQASFTAQAIEAAPDHATGHRWAEGSSVEIPFETAFPYFAGPAGDINAHLRDYIQWLRLQLGNGSFEGHRLVSEENLKVTRTPKVAVNDSNTYAMGWLISSLPNGRAIWHNGGTNGFGAHLGFLPDHNAGVALLSNQGNKGFPDAIAMWIYDRLLRNPPSDPIATTLAKVQAAEETKRFTRPNTPTPPPDLPSLAGDYHSDLFGPLTINAEAGSLIATITQTDAQLRLAPFDGAVFTCQLVGEGRFAPILAANGPAPFGFANFQADDTGHLSRIQFTSEGQSFTAMRA